MLMIVGTKPFQPPRMAKVQSQRRICFPRMTAEKEKYSSLENYSVQALPTWDHQIPQGCSPALLQNQVQHQFKIRKIMNKNEEK